MKLSICKRFKFDAGHNLPDYDGPCRRPHGHTFLLEVEMKGTINPDTHMLMDFKDLKHWVESVVIDHLDHSWLNDNISYPTAEEILVWIYERLNKGRLNLTRLRLYESEDSYVEWNR
jgi:6-pyruvoyltetrahydropterin/6-carboxytetrahydropterin synthase